ncbi:fibronectin type III domain-containing protein [Actinomadura darangshiensis]|uniref:Fibronectin type III domain-containing protein n=1 Tax=Actinomadura darangshiensis TaxID=705336 RepID=A0A4R5BX77_9ACTN|nr:fibronectin type III domain-containing protein [Actinomadura darangshiensis]TDD88922.1 fibronectin type III domain-containing protein [Actinomadura darangshiensis]
MAVTTDTGKPESIAKPNVEKPDGTSGTVEVTWTQTWDRDNRNLTYEVILDAETVVHSVEAGSRFWDLRTMTYTDTGLAPGTVHTYSIRAVDPFGNGNWSAQSDPVSG